MHPSVDLTVVSLYVLLYNNIVYGHTQTQEIHIPIHTVHGMYHIYLYLYQKLKASKFCTNLNPQY
jgi:hypothetical protein